MAQVYAMVAKPLSMKRHRMMQKSKKTKLRVALTTVAMGFLIAANARADSGLSANQLVELALEASPQIHSMHAQWQAAEHQIQQNYARPIRPLTSPTSMPRTG